MKKQLQVTKGDGSTEGYVHTKVIGTINHALATAGQPDIAAAEDLAEVVTFYLYDDKKRRRVASHEIFAMIKAMLVATGYEAAAVALNDRAFERRLKRSRTQVLAVDIQEFADAQGLYQRATLPERSPWDKGRIVHDLTTRFDVPLQTARTVAALVEERIFNMGMTIVPLSLIKQIVLGETASILRAERELHTVKPPLEALV